MSLKESQIEQKLINKLEELKYTRRPDIRDKSALKQNFRAKFEALNRSCVTFITPQLPINLTSLLHHRTIESERVEYRAGWNPEAALHSICALANDFHNLGVGYVINDQKEVGLCQLAG